MASKQHTPGESREYDVLLRLRLVEAMSDDDIATLAESIYEAVDTYAKSCVDGPAIGYTFEPSEIQLDFTTDVEDLADLQGVVDRVNEIIQGETSLKFTASKVSEAVSA